MSEARDLIAETALRIFSETIDQDVLTRAEEGAWPAEIWNAIEEVGLTRALLRPENGGAGGDWLDVFEIARATGRHSVPLPIVETILATWLLEQAGLDIPTGPIGLVPKPFSPAPGARLERIPWGTSASHLVGLTPDGDDRARIASIRAADVEMTPGRNIAVERRDTATLNTKPAATGDATVPLETLHLYGALLRTAQMTGALERLLDDSVQYASERVQFGRPIGNFQVIQQELARLAGATAEAATASEIAFRAAAETTGNPAGRIGAAGDPSFEIACAKVVLGDAAELGPRIAHQVHGAIGFTYEHSLHFSTRRLWAWRTEFGVAEEWAARLGDAVQDERPGKIWELVTSR